MTISTSENRKRYDGNDVTVNFSFPYYFFVNSDLVVLLYDSLGVPTTQVLDTDYTVTGAGDSGGGTVTMTTAPATGEQLVIYRSVALTQNTDYIEGDSFPANSHEQGLDRLTMIAQQLQEELGRSIKLNIVSDLTGVEMPDPVDGKALIGNTTNDGFINGPDAGDITSAQTYATQAQAAQTAAETAQTNAETAETNAETAETNAETAETNAAASAAAAQAAADSVVWNDVKFKTFSDTPIAVVQADDGALFAVDTSGGNVVIDLATIAGLTLPFTIGVKKTTADANTVTINRGGTDTIDGGTSYVLDTDNQGIILVADTDTAPDEWTAIAFGPTSGALVAANNLSDVADAPTALSNLGGAGLTTANAFTKTQKFAKGADIASAAALAPGTDGNSFDVTGAVTITSINTVGVGAIIKLHFNAALTLTHHATDLILPGGANITTAAGDEFEFTEYATGDWRCTGYALADGSVVAGGGTPDDASVTRAKLSTATVNLAGTVGAGVNITLNAYAFWPMLHSSDSDDYVTGHPTDGNGADNPRFRIDNNTKGGTYDVDYRYIQA